MRIPPASMAFTVLLSFLVALPSFGIDMSLPALAETGAALRVTPARAGLMMSLFMVGFAIAPLFYGPASDIDMAESPSSCSRACSSPSPGSAARWPNRCQPS
jgi:MFS family permease